MTSELLEEIVALPGQTYERTIALENGSSTPQRVRILQVDYVSGLDGASYYPAPEDQTHARSNAGWIALPRTTYVVPPDTTVRVPYTVAVPDGLAERGTYWSVLMVEPDPDVAPMEADAGPVEIRVGHRFRYAVHVAATIGAGAPAVSIAAPRLVDEVESRALKVDLRNEGTTIIRPDIWLEVFDASGESAGRFDARPRPLYPASVATAIVDLDTLPRGSYSALLFVDAGGDDLVGSRLTLEFPEPAPDPGSSPETDDLLAPRP